MARRTPPMKCGNAIQMRCIIGEKVGPFFNWECTIWPRGDIKDMPECATATIDGRTGRITFKES